MSAGGISRRCLYSISALSQNFQMAARPSSPSISRSPSKDTDPQVSAAVSESPTLLDRQSEDMENSSNLFHLMDLEYATK